jgi:glycosyltransferase involved in cell wall biosynthesis
MRILYDARSTRTPAGRYILMGLTRGWMADSRVSEVLVAVPSHENGFEVPPGASKVTSHAKSWRRYITRELSAIATAIQADVIFSPNATPPRDRRAVLYFQDLKHVRRHQDHVLDGRQRVGEALRGAWRRFVAPMCGLAVCVSEDIARDVRAQLPLPVEVIPNGVDVGGLWWSGERSTVLVMGGIGPWKGEETALRAWAAMPNAARKECQMAIVGVAPEDRRQVVTGLARDLRVEETVHVSGILPRAEFLQAIASSRIAVSCSRFESFGLPVAEALAIGAPVICTNLPAHVELVNRAGAGQLVPTDDPRALAMAVERAISGEGPQRLTSAPEGWSWTDRARQHVDAFVRHLPHLG